jgi:DNA repair protein RadA/Sms
MALKSSKTKLRFFCQSCGYESVKWLGKCPDCNAWNSFVEESVSSAPSKIDKFKSETRDIPKSILDIENKTEDRMLTGIAEFDRVLGGGIVSGSFVLIGGEPGIGKSTLLLQASNEFSKKYGTVLYVSGEESSIQTRIRAERIGSLSKDLLVVSETNLDSIDEHIKKINPKLVVIDSIQTIFRSDLNSSPGSVSQVRESAASIMYIAKGRNIPIFLVGHVTKDGSIAGPRVLEHIVDTVLYFEGDRFHSFRILRAYKNRFGPTDEIAVFEMVENGLKEINNPSDIFLSDRLNDKASGSVVIATLEGTRPILVEVQALTSTTYFGIPQRKTTGTDYNRFAILIAVLEKRAGFHLGTLDIFVNVVG